MGPRCSVVILMRMSRAYIFLNHIDDARAIQVECNAHAPGWNLIFFKRFAIVAHISASKVKSNIIPNVAEGEMKRYDYVLARKYVERTHLEMLQF